MSNKTKTIKALLNEASANALGYPVDVQGMDINNLNTLALKKVIDSNYFKETFGHVFVYRDNDEFSIGHGELNNITYGPNKSIKPHYFSIIDDKINDELDASRETIVLSKKQKKTFYELKECLEKSQKLSQVVNYFRENPETYYLIMATLPNKIINNSKDLIQTFRDKVDLNISFYKEKYKIEPFGQLAEPPENSKWEILDDLSPSTMKGLSKIYDRNERKIDENIISLSTQSFKSFIGLTCFGKEHSSNFINFSEDNDSEKTRHKILKKIQRNPVIYENSVYSILKEGAQNKQTPSQINESLYNNLYFGIQKENLLETLNKVLQEPSLEHYYEQRQKALDKTLKKVYKEHPYLNDQEQVSLDHFKFQTFDKEKLKNDSKPLDILKDKEKMLLYLKMPDQLSIKGILHSPNNHHSIQEHTVYVHNDLEVAGEMQLCCQTQSLENKEQYKNFLWTMIGTGLAKHHQDRQEVVDYFIKKSLDYISNHRMITEYSFPNEVHPYFSKKLIEQARERDDVFISFSSFNKDDLFCYGITNIKKKLYDSKGDASINSFNSDNISYNELLTFKKDFKQWYESELEPRLLKDKEGMEFEETFKLKKNIESQITKQAQDFLENKFNKKNKIRP